ncbi:MAG TPA: phage holin family protein [Gaiellaceae bacterium]|nr:phage holin family protein [Gaiellaceae bacterium]
MHTQETDRESAGLGSAAKQFAERASTLVRLELELATLELKRKVGYLAKGIVFGLLAAVLLVFGLGFALATIAAAIATATSTWLALLIVTGGVVLVAGLLGGLALRSFKKGTPPVPEQALREAKLTTEALKHDGHQ